MFIKTLVSLTLSLTALCALGQPIVASETDAPNLASAMVLVQSQCTSGCLIISVSNLAKLEHNIASAVKQGYVDGTNSCRNKI